MKNRKLNFVLRSNAVFSGLCGIFMLALASWLATLFASPVPWLFTALGIGLLGFSSQILLALRSGGPSRLVLWYFSASDFAWVAGSAIVLALGLVEAPQAVALVLGAAGVVLMFALLQVRHRAEARA